MTSNIKIILSILFSLLLIPILFYIGFFVTWGRSLTVGTLLTIAIIIPLALFILNTYKTSKMQNRKKEDSLLTFILKNLLIMFAIIIFIPVLILIIIQ